MVKIESVLISDAVDSRCASILLDHGISVTVNTKLTDEQLLEEVRNHDGLIVRSSTQVTKDVLDAGQNLKVVGRAGAGVDNIDVDAASDNNVIVLNTPGGNAISACELTCSLILNLARNVARAAESMRDGRWERSKFVGSEVKGKTLAILGLGRVGREVAVRMSAFGMKLVGYDPIVKIDEAKAFNTVKMELEEIWTVADYITVHTPLMSSTRNLINNEVIAKCKRGVFIINVGRGGIVNEKALLDGLNSGQVRGAALDVYEQEPPEDLVTLELVQHDHVVATPHLGASTNEAQIRVAIEIAEQIVTLANPENNPLSRIYAVNPHLL